MEWPLQRSKIRIVREYVESFVVAICLALFIRTFVVQAFKIPSGSMIPTLEIGDHILVNKFIYGIHMPWSGRVLMSIKSPKRGDVIVFRFPKDEEKDFIKRVIGIPGDTITLKQKKLYINGGLQEEPYAIYDVPAHMLPRGGFGPIHVPPDAYFVMGDNRDHSLDSRFWGFVETDKIKGKAFVIYWSWNSEATWVRWNRLARLIQ